MKRSLRIICTAASLTIAVAGIAGAQGMPPNGPDGRGPGGQGRMGMQHRQDMPNFQLMRVAHQISMLNETRNSALTREQARRVLAILSPLRSKPKLPANRARVATAKLQKILTKSQLDAIAKMRPQFGRGGMRGPGGQHQGMRNGEGRQGEMRGQHEGQGQNGEPGQNPGPGRQGQMGQRMGEGHRQFNRDAMKDFNPFYSKPGNKDMFGQRMSQRWDDFFNELKKRAR